MNRIAIFFLHSRAKHWANVRFVDRASEIRKAPFPGLFE